ncbi:MAG: hypothetical protein JKY50_15825, partial [Oleispira sp.]|nr:hypothetical protein [Oleispira sp.]MBL4881914.1 hypothetical protein [Oleispira sp.]
PTLADTDGDGLSDSVERSLNLDPRSRDTDSDLLSDAHEYNGIFSNPSKQDSDGDGLMDGEEVTFFKTSPLLDDTDGDQIMDGDEVILANRNARIADLAQPTIEIESITLELDVRFDQTKDATTTTGVTRTVSSTLTQSDTKTYSKTNEEINQISASATAETEFEVSAESLGIPQAKITASATAGGEHAWSASWSSETSKLTQNEYNKSLETTEAVSAGTTVSRHVEAARMSTLVYLSAAGDVAFTMRDLQITALVSDIRNPGKYLPVATLVPDLSVDGLNNEFNLGPLADKIGPLIFTTKDIFPAQVERLMRDPSGVIFKISNYNITDEIGRNFAYTSQDVVDRTSYISLDFGGAEQTGATIGEGTEFYRVATSFGRTIGSVVDSMAVQQQITPTEVRAAYGFAFDDVDSLISYDLSGKNIGVVFHDVMQNVLGLTHYDSATDIPASDASGRLFSYATTFNDNGVERITRIRQIENNSTRQWSLVSPSGLILDAQLSFGAGAIKADDQVLLSGRGISLAYVQDDDQDKIPARLEYLNGCSDSALDSDGDGLSDYLEVFGAEKNSDGAYANIADKWVVDVKAIGTYQGFSSCNSLDSDADGIPDFYEYHGFDAVTSVANLDGTVTNTFTAYSGDGPTPRTDAKKQDTDADGITDFDERKGYVTYLEFPLVPTSECKNIAGDTTPRYKVECTSNPLNSDTDGDGLPDGAELAFASDPTVQDAGDIADLDGDTLLGREESDGWPVTFAYSGLYSVYSSIDPLIATAELNTEDTRDITCLPDVTGCYTLSTSSSGDPEYIGISNYPGNVLVPTSSSVLRDTDGDGVWDNLEQNISLAETGYTGSTHPRVEDTDNDGRSDYEELFGYPYQAADFDSAKIYQGTLDSPITTNPLKTDSDRDGRSDGDEVNQPWIVSVVGIPTSENVYSNPNDSDEDLDGLNDFEEKLKGTHPKKANTDGDADAFLFNDGDEIKLGLNPLDPSDMCVKVTFTSFRVSHSFPDSVSGGIIGGVRVAAISSGLEGHVYFAGNFRQPNVDRGLTEQLPEPPSAYVLMKTGESIKVSTGGVKFQPLNGALYDVTDASLTVLSTEFTLAAALATKTYSTPLISPSGTDTFEPFFIFDVMTGTDVSANPTGTFCQEL